MNTSRFFLCALITLSFWSCSHQAEKPEAPAAAAEAAKPEPEVKTHATTETDGAICLGPDMSVSKPKESVITMRVDGSEARPFTGAQGKVAFQKLALNQTHHVEIYANDRESASIDFDFRTAKSNFVVIWKGAGTWKWRSVDSETCTWPGPKCRGSKAKTFGCR